MENEIVKYEQKNVAPFRDAWQEAEIFANSQMVPDLFRKPENCYVALRMAERMNVDLFMLMQNLYPVHGKVGIEAKFGIAMLNSSGIFENLEFEITGTGDKMACHCTAVRKSNGKTVSGPTVSIEMAKAEGWHGKSGSKWKTMPEMMLRYRAAMFFIRTNCPQVLLGMHSRDEIRDAVEAEIVPDTTQSSRRNERELEKSTETVNLADIAGDDKPKPNPIKPTHLVCRTEDCGAYVGLKLLSGCEAPDKWIDGENSYIKDARCCEEFTPAKISGLFKEIGRDDVKKARKVVNVSEISPTEDQWMVYEAHMGVRDGRD